MNATCFHLKARVKYTVVCFASIDQIFVIDMYMCIRWYASIRI